MKKVYIPLMAVIMWTGSLWAHHGVAALGAAGLEGPGAPLETSSSAMLPQGSMLLYTKLDYVKWQKFPFDTVFPDQKESYYFFMYGVGAGIKPYFSIYGFFPFYVKKELKSIDPQNPSLGQYTYTNASFSDISCMMVFGFKYDRGLKLVPKTESLDDMMDWHFTLYSGFSIPTGNPNIFDNARDTLGEFEPDMATGFGKPSVSFGISATKQFVSFPILTYTMESNYIKFFEYTYDFRNPDGSLKRYKFGDEFRANAALTFRTLKIPSKKFRLDFSLEAGYQMNKRDVEDGTPCTGSGGKILYGTLSTRVYYKAFSLGFGIKKPVWKSLNEDAEQQGGEGKEKERVIITVSSII